MSPSVELCLPDPLLWEPARRRAQPHLLVADHAIHAGLLLVQLRAGPADLLAGLFQPLRQQLHLLLQLPHLPLGLQPVLSLACSCWALLSAGRSAWEGAGPGSTGDSLRPLTQDGTWEGGGGTVVARLWPRVCPQPQSGLQALPEDGCCWKQKALSGWVASPSGVSRSVPASSVVPWLCPRSPETERLGMVAWPLSEGPRCRAPRRDSSPTACVWTHAAASAPPSRVATFALRSACFCGSRRERPFRGSPGPGGVSILVRPTPWWDTWEGLWGGAAGLASSTLLSLGRQQAQNLHLWASMPSRG